MPTCNLPGTAKADPKLRPGTFTCDLQVGHRGPCLHQDGKGKHFQLVRAVPRTNGRKRPSPPNKKFKVDKATADLAYQAMVTHLAGLCRTATDSLLQAKQDAERAGAHWRAVRHLGKALGRSDIPPEPPGVEEVESADDD